MTEEPINSEQNASTSLPGKLLDRRGKPEGVVPKQSQAYVIAGLAIMILLAVMFSKQHPKPAVKPAATAATPAPELNERKIADLKEELNSAQRQSEQAAHPSNGLVAGAQAGPTGASNIAAQPVGAQSLPAQDQHRDAIADAEKEIAFKSRFASNLVSENLPAESSLANVAQRLGIGRGDGHDPEQAKDQERVQASPLNPSDGRSPAAPGASRAASSTQTKRASELNLNAAEGQPFALFEGTTIDTALVNRLSGDFAGPVKVMVTNPVYSHDGQHILIPEGTFILGDVQKVDSFGQRRLAVTFHRLLMPDGFGVDLDRFHGLNQIGETGLSDQVNNHYIQIFGTSIALGIISGAAQATTTSSGYSQSGSDSLRQGIASSLAQSGAHALDRFLNILPTITIREGHRIKVYLSDDLLLPAYENHRIPSDI
jgi:type IV secretion system protein VirB10